MSGVRRLGVASNSCLAAGCGGGGACGGGHGFGGVLGDDLADGGEDFLHGGFVLGTGH